MQVPQPALLDHVSADPDRDWAPAGPPQPQPAPWHWWVSDGNRPLVLPVSLCSGAAAAATCCSSHCHSTKSLLPCPMGTPARKLLCPQYWVLRRKLRHRAKNGKQLKTYTVQFSLRETGINNVPYSTKHRSQHSYLST